MFDIQYSISCPHAQEHLPRSPGLVGQFDRRLDLFEWKGSADLRSQDPGGQELIDAVKKAEHGQSALSTGPSGQPKSFDPLVAGNQVAGIGAEGVSRERAIDQEPA